MLRVVLPTDFSENALHAAKYAVHMCGKNAEYILLHAYYDVGFVGPDGPAYGPVVVDAAQEGLARAQARFIEATGAERVSTRLLFGPLAMAVRGLVEEEKADLVVMGKRGETGSLLFGSNTTDVIKNSRVPVLAVPEHVRLQPLQRIVLGDDHDGSYQADYSMLRTLAARHKAEVIIAHLPVEVPEGADQWSSSMYNVALADVPHSFTTATGDDAVDALERLARRRHCDMLCVLHRHLGFMKRILNPSTAKELALQSDLPLLVLEQKG